MAGLGSTNLWFLTRSTSQSYNLLSATRHPEEADALEFPVKDLERVTGETNGLQLFIKAQLLKDRKDVGTKGDDGS